MNLASAFAVLVSFSQLSFVGNGRQSVGIEPRSLSIKYSVKQSETTLHEPVVLTMKVRNGFSHSITLDLGVNKVESFEFALTRPDGRTVRGLPQPSEGFYPSGIVLVDPGSEYEQDIVLDDWFSFETPGQYSLTADLGKKISLSAGENVKVDSVQLRFEIKPRNVNRLNSLCAATTKLVLDSPNSRDAAIPARLLSRVNDPVAVPYLAKTLAAHKGVEALSIEGLERIGSDDAVRVLLSELQDNFGGAAELAAVSLTRMEAKITSPLLKDAVQRALPRKSGD